MPPANDVPAEGNEGNRYPLGFDGRSIVLVAITLVWSAGYLARLFIATAPPVPREVDLAMAIVLGGTFGWRLVDAFMGRGRGGGA